MKGSFFSGNVQSIEIVPCIIREEASFLGAGQMRWRKNVS